MTQDQILRKLEKVSYADINIFVKKVCGEYIGNGRFRDVYDLKMDNRYVVKIEKFPEQGYFCNVTEYRNFIESKNTPVRKWLCPVLFISRNGRISVMRKAKFKTKDQYPKKLPSFLADIHAGNFAFIGRQFVCTDYAWFKWNHSMKLRKVKW